MLGKAEKAADGRKLGRVLPIAAGPGSPACAYPGKPGAGIFREFPCC